MSDGQKHTEQLELDAEELQLLSTALHIAFPVLKVPREQYELMRGVLQGISASTPEQRERFQKTDLLKMRVALALDRAKSAAQAQQLPDEMQVALTPDALRDFVRAIWPEERREAYRKASKALKAALPPEVRAALEEEDDAKAQEMLRAAGRRFISFERSSQTSPPSAQEEVGIVCPNCLGQPREEACGLCGGSGVLGE